MVDAYFDKYLMIFQVESSQTTFGDSLSMKIEN